MALLEITGIVIIAAIALLLFPINLNIESSRSAGTMYGRFSISWLLFKIRYSIQDEQTEFLVLSRRITSKQQTAQPETSDEQKKEKSVPSRISVPSGRSIHRMVDVFSLAGPVLQLLRSLVHTIRFRYVQFDTTFGFQDPAFTGILTGYLYALQGLLQHDIRFTPDFTRTVMDWDLKVCTSITPFWIFPPMLKFAANPQVLRTGWRMIRS